MKNLKVYYIVDYTNGCEWEPKIAFYDKKEADKFLNINHCSLFDGENGYKIKEDLEKEGVKIYSSVKEYLIEQKKEEVKILKEEIEKLEENEME